MIKRKNPYKPELDWRVALENVKVTKEDIERNLEKVKEGEALDIPLILLDRDFKKKYFSREWNKYYKKTDKGKGGDVYGKR